MPDTPSAGRVLWVTGAGSGIGRACAVLAASGGWRVALSGRREDALVETARAVEEAGGEAVVLPGDVGDTRVVADSRAQVAARWGGVDALVLAAGLNTPRRAWADQDLGEVEAVVRTNLLAVAGVVQAALPDLRARAGVVVVVSSVAGWTFSPGSGVAYSASKTALGALCRSLNAEEAASGVRACHLCPGVVDTDFLSLRPQVPDARARERMLTPADVARAAQFVLEAPPHVRVDELVITPTARV